ncbi:MAG: ABC transporter substrate-binding protein, partial [Ilumatobacteraceae bacterium]
MRSSRPTRLSTSSLRRLGAALAVGVLVLAACGDDGDDSSGTTAGGDAAETTVASDATADGAAPEATTGETEPGGSAAPEETSDGGGGDGGEVVVGAILEPTSLDLVSVAGAAIDAVLLDNVYETLLKLDEDGTVGPGLAALPEVSDDGTVYTFTLQDGVNFHSGEPLTSADVVWSLDAQRAEGANEAERLASIATVEAPDDQTVVVTLVQPDNDLSYLMTRRAGAVLQADATGLENSANGTGPFTFEEWNVGSSITLARNDDYWGDAPAISGVTFSYFTD